MKAFKVFLILAVLLFCSASVFVTAQMPDKIIYNGKEYKLHSNPMEDFFEKFPRKKPRSEVTSSALWRGYLATFEIADNQLLLKDIEIMTVKSSASESFETDWKSVLSTVAPGNKKLKIDWLTGLLVVPVGEIVDYVHMGYASTYERYILLEIEKGNFKRAKEFDYKEYEKFKERQFEAFKKTAEYKKMAADLKKKDNTTDEKIDSFLKSFITAYTSKILVD